MKLASLAALLILPLAGCLEVDVSDAAASPATPAASASARSGTKSDGLFYQYGASNTPADASVDPGTALNEYRAVHGLSKLRKSKKLTAAAQGHARDVARMGKVTHTGSDGSSIGDRARAEGYRYARIAENVAWTARGFPTVMQVWDDSPSHRETLQLRDVDQYGLARSGQYWVLMVGRSQ